MRKEIHINVTASYSGVEGGFSSFRTIELTGHSTVAESLRGCQQGVHVDRLPSPSAEMLSDAQALPPTTLTPAWQL